MSSPACEVSVVVWVSGLPREKPRGSLVLYYALIAWLAIGWNLSGTNRGHRGVPDKRYNVLFFRLFYPARNP